MKQLVSNRAAAALLASFREEIGLLLAFIERVSKQPGGTGIRDAVVDDPYWNTWLQWQGRVIGMERMLRAVGISADAIAEAKKVLPPKIRTFIVLDA